jgi:hypothetical protein
MSSDDLNPYAPPASAINDTQSNARWRIVPTTIVAVLGAGSFAIGLRVVALAVGALMIGDPKWRALVVVCVVWLAVGPSWMIAALFI